MDYRSNALTVLYYIVYPIVFILTLLLYILGIITAPLLYLGHYFLYALWYPVHILGKFEVKVFQKDLSQMPLISRMQTLYIFFGVAVLVGVITGTSLHYVYSFISSLLDLEGQPEEHRGRTLASYRREKQQKADDPLVKVETRGGGLPMSDVTPKEEYRDWEWSKQDRGKRRNGLINTILEEDSTDDF